MQHDVLAVSDEALLRECRAILCLTRATNNAPSLQQQAEGIVAPKVSANQCMTSRGTAEHITLPNISVRSTAPAGCADVATSHLHVSQAPEQNRPGPSSPQNDFMSDMLADLLG